MKFTLLALVASAAAIQIRAEEAPCVSMKQSDEVFKMVDTNKDGQLSKKELTKAVKGYLKKAGIHPSAAEEADFKGAAFEEAGEDKQLNPKEFNGLANEVCAYIES